jgi:hypothetical protein
MKFVYADRYSNMSNLQQHHFWKIKKYDSGGRLKIKTDILFL